jgi:hypothetical protein
MFGYVKPVPKELLVKEYDFYKATYCGVCRAMKSHTGGLSNVTLSYDSVILALVRMLAVEDSEIGAKMKRCIAHPLKKRCMLVENSALEYTARAFAILTYYKMKDDLSDEGIGKRLLTLPLRPVLSKGKRRAKIEPLETFVKEKLDAITRLERAGCKSVDEPAILFGELLGEVFAGGLHAPDVPVQSHNDHRIAMAMSLVLSRVGGEIWGAEAVAKSYPEYFDVLQKLGIIWYQL